MDVQRNGFVGNQTTSSSVANPAAAIEQSAKGNGVIGAGLQENGVGRIETDNQPSRTDGQTNKQTLDSWVTPEKAEWGAACEYPPRGPWWDQWIPVTWIWLVGSVQ